MTIGAGCYLFTRVPWLLVEVGSPLRDHLLLPVVGVRVYSVYLTYHCGVDIGDTTTRATKSAPLGICVDGSGLAWKASTVAPVR